MDWLRTTFPAPFIADESLVTFRGLLILHEKIEYDHFCAAFGQNIHQPGMEISRPLSQLMKIEGFGGEIVDCYNHHF